MHDSELRGSAGFAGDIAGSATGGTGSLRLMKIGFGAPVSGAWATPENLAGFAARAEQAGYASIWSFQRLLVPEGSAMDEVYQSVLDPMAALAYAAASGALAVTRQGPMEGAASQADLDAFLAAHSREPAS